jgi:uncharacterized membrane protein YphA (DoxX/SURF4 family)
MEKSAPFTLYLRLALAITMLSAVADRFGIWGAPGSAGVAWGNWDSFVAYTAQVNSFMPPQLAPSLALLATAAEIILSMLLIIGYQTKWAALGTGLLMTAFALAFCISFGIKTALDYSVFVDSAAGFLLYALPHYKWSLDEYLAKAKRGLSFNK